MTIRQIYARVSTCDANCRHGLIRSSRHELSDAQRSFSAAVRSVVHFPLLSAVVLVKRAGKQSLKQVD